MPQGRQALGLGLVVAAGLLYVSAGFAIQVITSSGVSAFLVSYISTCLFVLHFPCAALVRWWRRGGFRGTFGFQELPLKDKLSDAGGSSEGGSSQHWKEAEGAEGRESSDRQELGGALQGLAQGCQVDFAVMDDVGCGDSKQGSPKLGTAPPLGFEESFVDLSNRGASGPQTPIRSVLDAWRAVPVPSKLVELTPGKPEPLETRGENRAEVVGRTEKQHGVLGQSLVVADLAQQQMGLGVKLGSTSMGAAEYSALGCLESGVSASSGPSGPRNLGPFILCAEHLEAVKIAAVVGPLWFMAQYTYTLSLTLTTVTSNTILFSCTSLFTFLVSVVWLKEPFTFVKLGMIACAIVGTAVVSVSDAKSASASDGSSRSASWVALGNGLALLAAVVYAFYGTCMKYMNPEEVEGGDSSLSPSRKQVSNSVSTSLVFGYMGLLGGLFLLPWLLLLHWVGAESLHWMGTSTFGLLIVKALFGNVVADYLCARAMLLTSPTAASVGLAFQTPVAIVADFVIFGIVPKPLMLVGGILVMWGFLGINFNREQSKVPDSVV